MKKTKRKSFSFYRSYYDVFNELETNEDKLLFIETLFDKQFLDIDPTNLSGMVKFAYISQMDSIDRQVKGYCDKTKIPLNPNKTYPWQGCDEINKNPTGQEKEKDKEKVKEKEEDEVEKENTFHDIKTLKNHYLTKTEILKAIISNKDNKVKDINDLKIKLDLFCNDLKEQGRLSETWKEFSSYFRNCLRLGKFKDNPKEMTLSEKQKHLSSNITF